MSVRLALENGGQVLWSAHRTELVKQGFTALHDATEGAIPMGVMLPGHPMDRDARIHVSSTQTLLKRGRPAIEPSVIVLDEFHHYAAEEWKQLIEWWPEARILGPTATPQRGDGRPLSGAAGALVVAAHYSQLIAEGFLCDAVCYQPPEALQGGLALDPVEAWQKYSGGMPGFAFMPTIAAARKLAAEFNAIGIQSACIDAKTPKDQRRDILARFAAGELHVITNVDTMTEGVDVPRAGAAMLCRSFLTVGAYLQACGRSAHRVG
jgi:superfamily II DNA or RNA helicase